MRRRLLIIAAFVLAGAVVTFLEQVIFHTHTRSVTTTPGATPNLDHVTIELSTVAYHWTRYAVAFALWLVICGPFVVLRRQRGSQRR